MKIQFTREELINAIKQIDNNPKLITGRHSSTYDLVYNGNTYPPILVLSTANKLKKGKDLKLEDFGNNTKIPFKILRDNGFEISSKKFSSMKEQFSSYLKKSNKDGSQKASSYLRAIDLLDDILNNKAKSKIEGFNSIYDINSTEKIEELYRFVLNEQNNPNGIFQHEIPSSYWQNKFYSAALKSYQDFLNRNNSSLFTNENSGHFEKTINKSRLNIQNFHQSCGVAGLNYSLPLITRYIASLATKPFVLLSGLSGSGKTKLAQAFSQWISEDSSQYCIVPVGADWTNREPLLGYVNALDNSEYVKPENGALQLILKANKNEHKPYFLILDEMNLSHVERYFADFLSIMESKDIIKLHSSEDEKNDVPSKIDWPSNLFIVGTVNIDETTYMFSPKVLDRANVIEFRVNKDDIQNFLKSPKDIDFTELNGKGASMGEDFLKIASNKEFPTIDTEKLNQKLIQFFEELKKTGAEFGYRSATEIHRLYNQLSTLDNEMLENDKIDIAIMQKLLPKLHGSRRKLQPILEILASFCVTESIDVSKAFLNNKESINYKDNSDILYPLSLEKITRMYKGAIDNGFASYAEA
ncbi:McrB family protein [Gelidibacter gilvus]|nr:AAA family ATPase [Gelidibacter gilvus]